MEARPSETNTTVKAILEVLRRQLTAMEQAPSPYLSMDEENLRLVVMNPLNAVSPSGATAEGFNGRGKVDILIRHATRNLVLAECKIYTGPKAVTDAIDQLLGYATYRDRNLCLIIFVRSPEMTTAIKGVRAGAEASAAVVAVGQADEHGSEFLSDHERGDRRASRCDMPVRTHVG